jgi:hypothetical protein
VVSNVAIMRSFYILYLVRTRVETERRYICIFGFSTDVGFPKICLLRVVIVVVGRSGVGGVIIVYPKSKVALFR